jgi:hypothetical protein
VSGWVKDVAAPQAFRKTNRILIASNTFSRVLCIDTA